MEGLHVLVSRYVLNDPGTQTRLRMSLRMRLIFFKLAMSAPFSRASCYERSPISVYARSRKYFVRGLCWYSRDSAADDAELS